MTYDLIKNLKADEQGRFILDIVTPAEASVGKMFGCMTILMTFFSAFSILGILFSGQGFIVIIAKIFGLIFVTAIFHYLWKNIDCYYVLDDVGGQLLYHFSAILIVSEDPVANLEDVVGIGISYGGTGTSNYRTYSVMFCLPKGQPVRVSDFLGYSEAHRLGETLADLIKVPFVSVDEDSTDEIGVENGEIVKKPLGFFSASMASKETTTGCLMKLFLAPYIFVPALALMVLALDVNKAGERQAHDLNYYRRQKSGRTQVLDLVDPRVAATAKKVAIETEAAEKVKGTIVEGRGILGIVEIGQDLATVMQNLGKEPPSEIPPDKSVRHYFLDHALSVVFEKDRRGNFIAARIEIFRGKELPFKTAEKTGFGASMKEMFGIGDGKGNYDKDISWKIGHKIPGASFFHLNNDPGVEFREKGIAYVFRDDKLIEITVTPPIKPYSPTQNRKRRR